MVNCRLLGGRRGREGLHKLLAPLARDIWRHLLSFGDISHMMLKTRSAIIKLKKPSGRDRMYGQLVTASATAASCLGVWRSFMAELLRGRAKSFPLKLE